MNLSPVDYAIRALPSSSIEFPVIPVSLVGITCAVLAYATAFSEDAEGAADPAAGGFAFSNFGLESLGVGDSPRGADRGDANDDSSGLDEARARRTGGRTAKKPGSRRARGGKRSRRGGGD